MKPVDRLKKAVDFIKNSKPSLTSESIGVTLGYRSKSYVSDILNGSKPINEIFLEKLQSEYSVNRKWIMSGDGEMIIEDAEGNANEKPLEVREEMAPYGSKSKKDVLLIRQLEDTRNKLDQMKDRLIGALEEKDKIRDSGNDFVNWRQELIRADLQNQAKIEAALWGIAEILGTLQSRDPTLVLEELDDHSKENFERLSKALGERAVQRMK